MSYEQQQGQGWKTAVGSVLVGMGGISGADALHRMDHEAAIGAATFAGIGSYLIYKDKQQKKKKGKGLHGYGMLKPGALESFVHDHIHKILKKQPHLHFGGKGLSLAGGRRSITKAHAKQYLERHKDRKLTVKDAFGPNWKQKAKKVLEAIEYARKKSDQEGGNIFKDIGKAGRSAVHKIKNASKTIYKTAKKVRDDAYHGVKKFLQGKTSYKPSDLVRHLGYAVQGLGAISTALDAGIISMPVSSAINAGLQVGSKLLAESGRGLGAMKYEGHYGLPYDSSHTQPGYALSASLKRSLNELADSSGADMSKAKIGLALGIAGATLTAAYGLYKMARKRFKGKGGMYGSGSELSQRYKNYIKRYPHKVKQVLEKLGRGEASGSGVVGKIVLAGVALSLYGFLKENPHMVDQVKNLLQQKISGQGLSLAGGKSTKKIYKELDACKNEESRLKGGSRANYQAQVYLDRCKSRLYDQHKKRGNISGSGLKPKIPVAHVRWLKKYPHAAELIAKEINKRRRGGMVGEGIMETFATLGSLARGASKIFEWFNKHQFTGTQIMEAARRATAAGRGLNLSGQGLSLAGGKSRLSQQELKKKVISYLRNNPNNAKKIAQAFLKLKGGRGLKLAGQGKVWEGFKSFLKAAGLLAIGAGVGAFALYQFLLENPGYAQRIALEGGANKVINAVSGLFGGKGLSKDIMNDLHKKSHSLDIHPTFPSHKYKRRRKRGLIIGTMKEVWDKSHPAQITSGGKIIDDLMLNKRGKVVSKLKHLQGKKLYERLKK